MTESSYAELKQKLETVVQSLQSSEVDIDDAMKLHEEGTKLIQNLEKLLAKKENDIKKITDGSSK